MTTGLWILVIGVVCFAGVAVGMVSAAWYVAACRRARRNAVLFSEGFDPETITE